MIVFDTHAHLDFSKFNHDREKVIQKANDEGVKYIVNVGADLESSRNSVALSKQYPGIYATVGLHPHDAKDLNEQAMKELLEMAEYEKVVAIGEIGLDYHYDNSPRDIQREAFRRQLNLARALDLPVVIHSREADEDTLQILRESGSERLRGIMHCFGSGLEMAEIYLEMGLYLAFGGVLTFKNAGNLRRVVREMPMERLLVETDCPYLTPEPYRGKRNQPAYVKYVIQKIAEIKGISVEVVARITTENARRVYRIEGLA